jgi:hypothetical protein
MTVKPSSQNLDSRSKDAQIELLMKMNGDLNRRLSLPPVRGGVAQIDDGKKWENDYKTQLRQKDEQISTLVQTNAEMNKRLTVENQKSEKEIMKTLKDIYFFQRKLESFLNGEEAENEDQD